MWVSKIGDIRRSKGLQQKFIAKKINVSQQSLSLWERNETYPSADKLFDLAIALEVDVAELYKRE